MEERCPVCLTENSFEIEYDYTEHGDIEQPRCQKCGWPPTYPSTVEQWRRHYFISPYLADLEAMVAERDERIKILEAKLEEGDDG